VPLALLLWFYVLGSVFFFGAEFSAAWHANDEPQAIPRIDAA